MAEQINISSGSDNDVDEITNIAANTNPEASSSYSPEVVDPDSNHHVDDILVIFNGDEIHNKSEASDYEAESIAESRDPEHTVSELSQEYIEDPGVFPFQEGLFNEIQERIIVLERERKTLENFHEEQVGNLNKEVTRLTQSLADQKSTFDNKETLNGLPDSELVLLVQRKDREIFYLNQQLDTFTKRFSEISNLQQDDRTRFDKLEAKERQLKLREQSLDSERELLTSKNNWLTEELSKKNKEFVELRSNKQQQVDSLEEEVNCKASLIEEIKEECQKCIDEKEELRRKLDKCLANLDEQHDELSQMEERNSKELNAYKKLAQLYKESAETNEGKLKELLSGAEQLQNINTQMNQRILELEARNEEQRIEFDSKINDFKSEVNSLQNELLHANELIDGINVDKKDFSHAQIHGNLSMTEIYTNYVTAEEKAKDLEDKNTSLSRNLELFKIKVDEKIPLVRRQKEENFVLKQANNTLKEELTRTQIEIENLNSQSNLSILRSRYLDRENKQLQETMSKLKCQICILLKDNEEARGISVSTLYHNEGEQARLNLYHDEVSSSCEPHLITFRSIEELQQRNVELLSRIGELESKMQEQLKQSVNDKVADTQTRLTELMQTVQQIKDSKRQQNEMLQRIVEERDKYKMLLAQTTPLPIPIEPMTAEWPDISFINHMQTEQIQDKDKIINSVGSSAHKELQQTFDQYKSESERLRKELMSEVSQLRDDKSSLTLESSRLCNKLEFATQRFELLKAAYESQRTENQLLKDKFDQGHKQLEELEQTVRILTKDQFSSNEKLSYFNIQNESLEKKIEAVKASEERAKQQIDSLLSEKREQNLLKANLEAIQNTLERSEQETKARINQQIKTLEDDLNYAKIQLENKDRQQEKMTNAWQTQIDELKFNLITTQNSHNTSIFLTQNQEKKLSDLETALAKAYETVKDKNLELAELVDSLKSAESGDMVMELKDEVSQLKFSLSEIQSEHKSVECKLMTAKEHIDQYKAIAEAMEISLSEQNRTMDIYLQDTEDRLKSAEDTKSKLKIDLDKVQFELNKQLQVNEELNSNHEVIIKKNEEDMTYLKNQLDEAITTQVLMEEKEKQLNEDRDIQARLAKENQASYERELMQHGKCMEIYTQSKVDIKSLDEKLGAAQRLADEHILLLDKSTNQLEESKTMHGSEVSQLLVQIEDLKSQNTLLYSQLANINAKLVTITNTHTETSTTLVGVASISELSVTLDTNLLASQESESQLRELISILRREKEIAETKYELAESERIRLSEECTRATCDLEEVKTVLESEQETLRAQTDTVAQHSKLLEKVNTLNILYESNKVLREEKSQSETKLLEVGVKLKKTEEENSTLKSSNLNLSSTKDILLAEKTALKHEISRWQNRVNKLLEKYDKVDPEEFIQLKHIKEAHENQISNLENTICKLKEDVCNRDSSIEKLERESDEMKAGNMLKIDQHDSELEEIKRKVTTAENELEAASTKTKKYFTLARNYKNTSETNAKKIIQLEDQHSEEIAIIEKEKSQLMAEWQEKNTSLTEMNASLANTNTLLTEQLEQNKVIIKEKETRISKLEELLKKATQRINKERNATTELESLKIEYQQLKSSIADKDANIASSNEEHQTKIDSLEQKVQQLEQDLKSQVSSSNFVSTNISTTSTTSSPSVALVKPIISAPCPDTPPTVLIPPFCVSSVTPNSISHPSTILAASKNVLLQSTHPAMTATSSTTTTTTTTDTISNSILLNIKRKRDDSDQTSPSSSTASGLNLSRKKVKTIVPRNNTQQSTQPISLSHLEQPRIILQEQQPSSAFLPTSSPQTNLQSNLLACSIADETPEVGLIDSTSTNNPSQRFMDNSEIAEIRATSDSVPLMNLPRTISADSQSHNPPSVQLPISTMLPRLSEMSQAIHSRLNEMNHEVPNTPILAQGPPGLGHDIPYHIELQGGNSPPPHPIIDAPDSSSLTENAGEAYINNPAELFSYDDEAPLSTNQEIGLVSQSIRIRSADDDSVSPSLSHRVPSTSDSPTSTPGPLVSTSSQSHPILSNISDSNFNEANEAAVNITTLSNIIIESDNLSHHQDETDTNNEVESVLQSELIIDITNPVQSLGPEQSAGVTSLDAEHEITVEASEGEGSSTADDDNYQEPIILSSPGSCNVDDDDADCNNASETAVEGIPTVPEEGEISAGDEQQSQQIGVQSIDTINDSTLQQQQQQQQQHQKIEQTVATSSSKTKPKGSSIVPIVWNDKIQQQQQASSSSSTTNAGQTLPLAMTTRRRATLLGNIQDTKSKMKSNTK